MDEPTTTQGSTTPIADLHGRRGKLIDALTHRLAYGPALSGSDYDMLAWLTGVLDLDHGRLPIGWCGPDCERRPRRDSSGAG